MDKEKQTPQKGDDDDEEFHKNSMKKNVFLIQSAKHPFAIHESTYYCDSCNQKIRNGKRWHCTECLDFDFCETCHFKVDHPHKMIFGTEMPAVLYRKVVKYSTSVEIMVNAFRIYSHLNCFGIRTKKLDKEKNEIVYGDYEWQTYAQVFEKIEQFAYGLIKLKFASNRDFIGICGSNRPEWLITDWACLYNSMVVVPISTSSSVSQVEYIINLTEIKTFVCEEGKVKEFLEQGLFDKCPNLRGLIIIPEGQTQNTFSLLTNETLSQYSKKIKIQNWYSVLINSKSFFAFSNSFGPTITKPDDLVTVSFTSGSTGTPKGAMFHENIWYHEWKVSKTSVDPQIQFSWTPYAHLTGRLTVMTTIVNGGRTGFFSGDMENLLEDIQALNPTVFLMLPILANKLYKQYQALVELYSETETYEISEERALREMRYLLGERVMLITCGTAPTSEKVKQFLSKCFSVKIIEGYGSTECGPISTNNMITSEAEVILVDVPEFNYFTTDKPYPRGEICVHSNRLIAGYFKKPELNNDLFFLQNGKKYARTGDIGRQIAPFQVEIIDRKKDIFKLAQGLYVSPAFLETIFLQSTFVRFIFVYGNPIESFVVAAVVPHKFILEKWKQEYAIENVCEDKAFKQFLFQDIVKKGRENKLLPHEIPHSIYVDQEEWTPQNGLLTESFKFNRRELEKHYAKTLENLYKEFKEEQQKKKADKEKIQQLVRKTLETVMNLDSKDFESESLISIGMSSLDAVRISSSLEKELQVQIPIPIIFNEESNLSTLTQYLMDPLTSNLSDSTFNSNTNISQKKNANIANYSIDLKKEFEAYRYLLDECFSTVDFTDVSDQTDYHLKNGDCIFLTGSTGFIGRVILVSLLEIFPDSSIICLVRNKTKSELKYLLQENQLWNSKYDKKWETDKVEVLSSDLSKLYFGLSEEDFQKLSDRVDCIIHSAAQINTLLGYPHLKLPNVEGTLNVIRLASWKNRNETDSKLKRKTKSSIFFLSSMSALDCCLLSTIPDSINLMNTFSSERASKAGGYSQSKFLADCLVAYASKNGRLPVQIFRLGFISSHTKTGTSNTTDWFNRLLAAIISTKSFCWAGSSKAVELIPVDWTVSTLLSLSQFADFGNSFPLITSSPTKLNDIFQWIIEFHPEGEKTFGIEKSYSAWIQAMKRTLPLANPFFPLLYDFENQNDYVSTTTSSFHSNFPSQLENGSLQIQLKSPPITKEIFKKSFEYLKEIKYF